MTTIPEWATGPMADANALLDLALAHHVDVGRTWIVGGARWRLDARFEWHRLEHAAGAAIERGLLIARLEADADGTVVEFERRGSGPWSVVATRHPYVIA